MYIDQLVKVHEINPDDILIINTESGTRQIKVEDLLKELHTSQLITGKSLNSITKSGYYSGSGIQELTPYISTAWCRIFANIQSDNSATFIFTVDVISSKSKLYTMYRDSNGDYTVPVEYLRKDSLKGLDVYKSDNRHNILGVQITISATSYTGLWGIGMNRYGTPIVFNIHTNENGDILSTVPYTERTDQSLKVERLNNKTVKFYTPGKQWDHISILALPVDSSISYTFTDIY